MAKLLTTELADVMSNLAPILELKFADLTGREADDLFLCALGFEPRCVTIPKKLSGMGYRYGRARFLTYATNLDDNAVNRGELEGYLQVLAPDVEWIEADGSEFSARLRSTLDAVVSAAAPRRPRVTLDLSVMANRVVLKCLRTLLEYDVTLRIFYSEAAVYYPTREDYESEPQKWGTDGVLGLEQGVRDVVPSIEHAGYGLDPCPDAVVLFPSFKAERSRAVISFVDPSLLNDASGKVVWLVGEPHLPSDKWRVAAMRRINGIVTESRQYTVSTFDYRETIKVLEKLYGEISSGYRITLSPLGSKMQAVGTALFCYLHADVRVVLSTPKEYNAAQYSKGCKATWRIDLGSLSELRQALNSVGTLRVEDGHSRRAMP